jgi:hypothetical protein
MTAHTLALHAAWAFGARSSHKVQGTTAAVRRWRGESLRLFLGLAAAVAMTAGVFAAIVIDLESSFSSEVAERQARVLPAATAVPTGLDLKGSLASSATARAPGGVQ